MILRTFCVRKPSFREFWEFRLDRQQKGKTEPKAIFIDGDLKDYAGWTIMHKNFK